MPVCSMQNTQPLRPPTTTSLLTKDFEEGADAFLVITFLLMEEHLVSLEEGKVKRVFGDIDANEIVKLHTFRE